MLKPSDSFNIVLPKNPSHTIISAFPKGISLGSIFPIKFKSVFSSNSYASFVSASPFSFSAPILTSPTVGF